MKAPEFPILVKRGSAVVKIYRTETRGHIEYVVAYYEGQQRKREKFADLDKAKAEAAAKATALCTGELDVLSLRSEDKALYVRACNAVRPFGVPLDLAAVQFADARRKLGETPLAEAVDFYLSRCPRNLPRKTVAQVYDDMIAAKENDGLSAVYLKDLRFRVGKFKDAFQCQIGDVSASMVNEYLRALKCSGRSRNNHRMAISTLFKFAEGAGYLPKGHTDFDQVAKAKEGENTIDIFTPKEISSLLEEARTFQCDRRPGVNRRYTDNSALIAYLALGAFAGLRTAEIQRQLWSDVNLERGFIRVTAAKGNTAQKRLVPISDNLQQWLLLCRRDSGVCCDYANVTDAVSRIVKKAGVKWKHNALRHSFISYRVAQTQNIPQASLEAGNSVAVINGHYRELVTTAEAEAWFSVRPGQVGKIVAMVSATG